MIVPVPGTGGCGGVGGVWAVLGFDAHGYVVNQHQQPSAGAQWVLWLHGRAGGARRGSGSSGCPTKPKSLLRESSCSQRAEIGMENPECPKSPSVGCGSSPRAGAHQSCCNGRRRSAIEQCAEARGDTGTQPGVKALKPEGSAAPDTISLSSANSTLGADSVGS